MLKIERQEMSCGEDMMVGIRTVAIAAAARWQSVTKNMPTSMAHTESVGRASSLLQKSKAVESGCRRGRLQHSTANAKFRDSGATGG
jgi:hypothetical protein